MLHLRLSHVWRVWLVVASTVILALGVASGWAVAQTSSDLFTVHNIAVDLSGDNLAALRDKAIAAAPQQAVSQVLQRLAPSSDWGRLPKVSDKEAQDLVLDVVVDQEKRSSVRYLATLSVRFKPDAIRRVLRNASIAYAEWRGRPIAILPIWQSDNGPLLFEPNNPWRDAWKAGGTQGIVPLVIPQPPPTGQTDPFLAPVQVASGSADELATIARRYNTTDVIVAVAQPHQQENNRFKLDVTLFSVGPVGGLLTGARSYLGEVNETSETVLRRAVDDLTKTVNDGWRGGNTLQFDRSGTLTVVSPLSGSLAEWTQLREKLVRSTPVRSFEVVSISRSEANLILHFVGDQSQLEAIFTQNGLSLTQSDDHWILQNASMNSPLR